MSDALGLIRSQKNALTKQCAVANAEHKRFQLSRINIGSRYCRLVIDEFWTLLLTLAPLFLSIVVATKAPPCFAVPLILLGALPFYMLAVPSLRKLLKSGSMEIDEAGIRFVDRVLWIPVHSTRCLWSNIEEISVSKGSTGTQYSWGHVLSIYPRTKVKKAMHLPIVGFHPQELASLGEALHRHAPESMKSQLQEVAARACSIRDGQTHQSSQYDFEYWDNTNLPTTRTITAFVPMADGETIVDGPISSITVIKLLSCGGMNACYEVTFEQKEAEPCHGLLLQLSLPKQIDAAMVAESFKQRVEAHGKTPHPLIVKPVCAFQYSGSMFVLYNHIPGTSLRSLIKTGKGLKEKQAREIQQKLLQAMTATHMDSDTCFGDLSPESLLMEQGKLIAILPVSSFQIMGAQSGLPIIGKPAFVSREQICQGPSHAGDIYAAGALLYYMLTGLEPDPIGPLHPSAACYRVSMDMDSIVAQATAYNPENRFTSAIQFEKALLGDQP